MDHVSVAHVSTDTHGSRSPDSFGLNDQSTKAKCELIEQRWPHLSMIGDFHTHPYNAYGEVMDDRGWEFSDADYEWYESGHTRETWPGRVGLVLTLAELKRHREDNAIDPAVKGRHGNILHWQLGRYRFWMSAYAIDSDNGELAVSPRPDRPRSREHVYIDVPTINGTDAWFTYD